jgi:hypothetical protein
MAAPALGAVTVVGVQSTAVVDYVLTVPTRFIAKHGGPTGRVSPEELQLILKEAFKIGRSASPPKAGGGASPGG